MALDVFKTEEVQKALRDVCSYAKTLLFALLLPGEVRKHCQVTTGDEDELGSVVQPPHVEMLGFPLPWNRERFIFGFSNFMLTKNVFGPFNVF